MKKIFISAVLLCVFCTACSFSPPCINEKTKGMMLSWGEQNKITQKVTAYTLLDNGKIYYYEKEPGIEKISKLKIVKTTDEDFCNALAYTIKGFIDNQVLNTPGVVSRFIEFRTPATKAVMRGTWNPTFKQNGSEEFVKMYEYLMQLVPDTEDHKSYLLREVSSTEEQFQAPKEVEDYK